MTREEQRRRAKIEQELNHEAGTNKGYEDANALQIRLDTQPIISKLERYLKGRYESIRKDNDGNIEMDTVESGEPKANDKGVQSILAWVSNIVNPQVVQGNFDGENIQYGEYMKRQRQSFSVHLMKNLHEYGIDPKDWKGIVDSIFSTIDPFMTRLIDNKERESYETTIRHSESQTQKVSGSSWNPFRR